MTYYKPLVAVCLTAMLLITPCIYGMTEFGIPQLREMNKQGEASRDFIMNLVMMGLPADLMSRLKLNLQQSAASGAGGFQNTGLNQPASTFPQQPAPQVPSSTIEADTNTTDLPTIDNIDSTDPILLNQRRKRSFDNFFNSGYGISGFGGTKGIHPGIQNGNLFGGNARSFIQYPGTFTGGFDKHDSFIGGFDKHVPFNSGGSVECPRQVDQGFIYQYSADPFTYPALQISNELFVRSLPGSDLLFQALQRQVVFPTDPPQIFVDPFILTSNATCRFLELQIWSYQSQTYTGRCYPLVNFQETPFFKTCLNRFCKCEAKNDFFRSSFSYGKSNLANLCITEYETVSLWSYCEQLIQNRRIVRDRILVPDACTCSTVNCFPTGFHK